MKRSSVVESLPSSGIRRIFEEVQALEQQGVRCIRFDIGLPDVATPSFAVDSAKNALDEGFTKYVSNRGTDGLRNAISRKLAEENSVHYSPDSEIVVTCGASEAVAVAMMGILELGSDVLVPQPIWPHYVATAQLAGADVVEVPLDPAKDFDISYDLLKRYVTPNTRMLVLNSPNNPTGKVYDKQTLRSVLDFALDHDIYVLADEVYEYFVYDFRPPSFASLPGARDCTILINGFSKAFGMTGWRLGYLAAPKELAEHLNKVHQYFTVCATSFAQMGAVAAYTHTEADDFLRKTHTDFKQRYEVLLEETSSIKEMGEFRPKGAFYFFPTFPDRSLTSSEACMRLLSEGRVAAVPGEVFGATYDHHLRISYGSCSIEDLREGLRRVINILYT